MKSRKAKIDSFINGLTSYELKELNDLKECAEFVIDALVEGFDKSNVTRFKNEQLPTKWQYLDTYKLVGQMNTIAKTEEYKCQFSVYFTYPYYRVAVIDGIEMRLLNGPRGKKWWQIL